MSTPTSTSAGSKPNWEIAQRAIAVAMKAYGIKNDEVSEWTGMSVRTIQAVVKKAKDRGYNPEISKIVLNHHVKDAPRSGRPPISLVIKQSIAKKVQRDRYGREKTCEQIALELNISTMTVWRTLRCAGFKKTKPTYKPGLTVEMKAARLRFCKEHEHWTLEEWKAVIWSDETSVLLGHRRGGYRIWRRSDERYLKSTIRTRWKGFSEFMFWGCFSYNFKGPCHIWQAETVQERKDSEVVVDALNQELEPIMKEQWELQSGMSRLGLRNKPGKTPEWRWTQKNGKLSRNSKGGIDWYRYYKYIVLDKLIPFAQECSKTRSNILVQEDNAPSHAHAFIGRTYNLYQIARLLWPGNSADLNMIEPCWYWMKRETTKKGAPTSRAEAARVWRAQWAKLDQARIQRWIERIVAHIKKVIELEGGNEYKEGRDHLTSRAPALPAAERGL